MGEVVGTCDYAPGHGVPSALVSGVAANGCSFSSWFNLVDLEPLLAEYADGGVAEARGALVAAPEPLEVAADGELVVVVRPGSVNRLAIGSERVRVVVR
ncbi:MAG: hypothetical protein DCC71_15425 [Proteobacteria bacterium]|nr:MAG: hypothetical protein DCC71_15425 [Pseudomonadota bacterium]